MANSFNTGVDQIITISNDQGGPPVTLDGPRSMFTMKAVDEVLKSAPIDNGGLTDRRVIPDGWAGSVEVERNNDGFGPMAAFLDANYYAGGDQQFFTIVETIYKRDGSGGTARYQYLGCVFHGYDPGDWQKKQITKAKVSVDAQQRIELS